MKIKMNEIVAGASWHLKKGQIIDSKNYPNETPRWLANGTASRVDAEVETATRKLSAETTSLNKAKGRRKKQA